MVRAGVGGMLFFACFCVLQAQPVLDIGIGGHPIAIDRTGAPALYYGQLRSLDDGATWSAYCLTSPGLPQPPLSALVTDPGEPSTVYYATDLDHGGIWKSADCGETWAIANAGLPAGPGEVEDLYAAVVSPYALYARIGDKIYKSTDRAVTWTEHATLPFDDGIYRIAFRNPSLQFHVRQGAVRRSTDDGQTWWYAGAIPVAPPGETSLNSVIDLATDAYDFNLVYALETGPWISNSQGYYYAGFWRSYDQGATWGYIHGPSVSWIAVDPAGGPEVYVTSYLGPSVKVSRNHGTSWDLVSIVSGVILGDTHLALSDARPNVIYAATPRGVYRSDDRAATWTPLHGTVSPTLALPAESLELRAQEGLAATQTFDMQTLERAEWSIPFTITSDSEWLTVDPAQGQTPATVTISAGAAEAGVYEGNLTFASEQASHGPLTVPVRLTITEVDPAHEYVISTAAGRGSTGSLNDEEPATQAGLHLPWGAAMDNAGNLLIADSGNHRIRMVTPDGIIHTVAGTGAEGYSGDGGPALEAELADPRKVLPDPAGGFYIADYDNNCVRKVDGAGVIQTVVAMDEPSGLALDREGNLYVSSEELHGVYRIYPGGARQLVVGDAHDPRLRWPAGIAVNSAGALYIAETYSDNVYKWSSGQLTVVAGTGAEGYNGDGQQAVDAMLNRPEDVVLDGDGNIYIADALNHRVRMVDPAGIIQTIAGTGVQGSAGDGNLARLAQLAFPVQVWPTPSGVLYVTDRWNYKIRKLEVQPIPNIFAGGIVNAASFSTRVAPGSLISVFGSNLSAGAALPEELPLPRELASARLLINGLEVPLTYSSTGQLNGQLPYETVPGQGTAVVQVKGAESAPAAVEVVAAAPGIFQWGANRAVAQNQDWSLNAPEAPAAPGSYITVYLTGTGLLDNPVPTGTAAPVDPLSRPLATVAATLGGVTARVMFLGLTPGFVGLAQANLEVPDLTPGDYPLLIRIGEESSNTPLIAVGAP